MRAPYAMLDVELEEPLAPVALAAAEGGAHVLLRHRRRPVGRVWLNRAKHGARISAETLAALVDDVAYEPVSALALRDSLLGGLRPVASPLLTIAVCTRNRTGALRRCLAALVAVRDAGLERGPAVDILVADNAPTDDRTRQVASEFPGVRYTIEPAPGLGITRNHALANTARPWIAYVADDAVVDPSWLDRLAEAVFASPAVGCFTGPSLPLSLETEAQLRFEHATSLGNRFDWIRFGRERWDDPVCPASPSRVGAGACMVFRTEALRDLGGFDAAFDSGPWTAGGGDLDMFYRVLRAGYPVICVPGLLVHHERPRDTARLVRQYYSGAHGAMASLRKVADTDPDMRSRQRALLLRWTLVKLRGLLRSLSGRGPNPPHFVLAEISGGIAGYFAAYPRSATRPAPRKSEYGT